ELDRAMAAILSGAEEQTHERIAQAGLSTSRARTNAAPVFDPAYLVYEAQLVAPGKDIEGQPIFPQPWVDVGSHRVYFLEINAIQLREDIAQGRSQIAWRSLPTWAPEGSSAQASGPADASRVAGYQKGYTPFYSFPSRNTVAFEADEVVAGR